MTKPPRPWWKKLLRFTAFALIALVTLLVLASSWISFQGRRDWAKTKADLTARGEKLSLVELAPAPIPDEQNFFGDPIWKELDDLIDAVSKEGEPIRVPRLPRGQRKIDAIDPTLPSELRERAKTLLPPDLSTKVSGRVPCSSAAVTILSEARKRTDPAEQRSLGQLALDVLAPAQPMRSQIETLLLRPGAVGVNDYSDAFFHSADRLNYLLTIARVYGSLAEANLAIDRPEIAAPAVLTQIRLSRTMESDPLLIFKLVQVSILSSALSVIDRGLATHRWQAAQLTAFENALSVLDLPHDWASALRAERGNVNQFIEAVNANRTDQNPTYKQMNAGLGSSPLLRFAINADQGSYNRYVQQYIDALESPDGIAPECVPGIAKPNALSKLTHMLTSMAAKGLIQNIQRGSYTQETLQFTRIACALERYRLKKGSYPASLDALAPEFLPSVPHSVLAGAAIHYQLAPDGEIRLWSEGWDLTDDHGTPGPKRVQYQNGDWVWNLPPGTKRP